MTARLKIALLAPVAALSLSGCGVNAIPTAEEQAKAQWANVEAAFQRRANLIPNLVSTVRAAAASEENILTGVTQARADATRVTISPDQLDDPEAMRRFAEAQGRFSAAILPLQRLQEAYPQLQSQQNFTILMSQLESAENRINIEIRDYNEAVRNYNTTIRTFPNVIGANIIYGSEPLVPYEAATPNAGVAPTVDFGNGQ